MTEEPEIVQRARRVLHGLSLGHGYGSVPPETWATDLIELFDSHAARPAPSAGQDEHEDHPCGLCDATGRCTFACETAESVTPPHSAQVANERLRATLALSAEVLADLAHPEIQPRTIKHIQEACVRLHDEILEVLK